ncbi:cytidine deaminase-like protein [Xylariaceae sp. FL0016]|nr:cytidine deaminase-like protein [Xylariaceae sp. FL0016]
MLIGICGSKCAGKTTVAEYLVEHHGFKKLCLELKSQEASEPVIADASAALASSDETATPTRDGDLLTQEASADETYAFTKVSELLDFVTKRWRDRWVTTDVHDEYVLDALSRRPFFILISVDAPVTMRWKRYEQRRNASSSSSTHPPTSTSSLSHLQPTTFESFVQASDEHLYDPRTGVIPLVSRATLRIINSSPSLSRLRAHLDLLRLPDPGRLRPSWDAYFMSLAELAAHRANCMKRAVGCVLVDAQNRVLATGYNGTPRHLRNCSQGGCPRCNAGESSGVALATCLCLHAEENALLLVGRERIRDGVVLYCNTCPCLTCSIKIVQVGIAEVVYNQGYSMDGETARVFNEAGVKLRQFSPPPNGLIHLERLQLF